MAQSGSFNLVVNGGKAGRLQNASGLNLPPDASQLKQRNQAWCVSSVQAQFDYQMKGHKSCVSGCVSRCGPTPVLPTTAACMTQFEGKAHFRSGGGGEQMGPKVWNTANSSAKKSGTQVSSFLAGHCEAAGLWPDASAQSLGCLYGAYPSKLPPP